jgi:hypothetical protein
MFAPDHRLPFAMLLGLLQGPGPVAAVAAEGAMDRAVAREEVCLNGDMWTFQPVRRAYYGYEVDAPGRWKPAQRSHRFIIEALTDPANDWDQPRQVRVPMAWSCATSEPGARDAVGDFRFPAFWQYVHVGSYARKFAVPASFHGKRIKLVFESVNFRCWVYVNDVLVRRAEGGDFTHENKHPFELDVTDHVRAPSEENRLRVVVHDFTASFRGEPPNEDHRVNGIAYPLGDRCDYYNKDRGWRNIDSGIIGDVLLVAVPTVNVQDTFIRTSLKDAAIEVDVTVRNEGPAARAIHVAARVMEWTGGGPAVTFADRPGVTLAPGETRTIPLRQRWTQPRLWWPHDPFLYRLTVDLLEDSRLVCSQSERFGFREVEMVSSADVDRRGFYLNGVRVRLFGESVEPTWKDGYTEGVGTSGLYLYNPEYWSLLLDEAKRLNLTVLRPHRGMWLKRMFEIADEKGMMMIAESTINNGNHDGAIGTPTNQRRAIRDLICSLRNHPSVVIWSLANESPFQEEWTDEAARHDRTRPCVATQTTPRNHPSPALAAASGSYAMGLSGYQPNIYGRHDANWDRKPLYIYEDNACYDQPEDADRLRAVQQGLTIFRGHRSSGYEIICTFYTWQKLYGQPRAPVDRLLPIRWHAHEVSARGYRPDQARMPLLDPWSDRDRPRVIRPLSDHPDPPAAFWQRSFAPVAVFDRAYDERLDVGANPYVAPFDPVRTLMVHNDDLLDPATTLQVAWTVQDFDQDVILSSGTFELEVPLGGMRRHEIRLDVQDREAVRVTYHASKTRRERFRETIYLRGRPGPVPVRHLVGPPPAAPGEIVLEAAGPGVESRGYRLEAVAGQVGAARLVADPVSSTDYVQFQPLITVAGHYHVFLHVPPGLSGTQGIEIRHDSLNTTVVVDVSAGGWIRLTSSPVRMQPGELQNAIRIGRGGTAVRSVVNALKLVRVP